MNKVEGYELRDVLISIKNGSGNYSLGRIVDKVTHIKATRIESILAYCVKHKYVSVSTHKGIKKYRITKAGTKEIVILS